MKDMLIFGDDYFSGGRVLSRESLVHDILLYGQLTTERMYMIIYKIKLDTRGDYELELGRLLRYRHDIIMDKLN